MQSLSGGPVRTIEINHSSEAQVIRTAEYFFQLKEIQWYEGTSDSEIRYIIHMLLESEVD